MGAKAPLSNAWNPQPPEKANGVLVQEINCSQGGSAEAEGPQHLKDSEHSVLDEMD